MAVRCQCEVLQPCIGIKDRLQLVDPLEEPVTLTGLQLLEEGKTQSVRYYEKDKNEDASYAEVKVLPLLTRTSIGSGQECY